MCLAITVQLPGYCYYSLQKHGLLFSHQKIGITKAWYSFLLSKLGNDLPEVLAMTQGSETGYNKIAQKVWGSFNDYNDIVGKLKRHIGEIGRNFVFKKVTDLTIDNDKLHHQS